MLGRLVVMIANAGICLSFSGLMDSELSNAYLRFGHFEF